MRLNGFKDEDSPTIAYGEVSHVDLREMSEYISKLTAAGLLMPDERLEEFLRDIAGLPAAEEGAPRPQPAQPETPEPKTTKPENGEADAAELQQSEQTAANAENAAEGN